MIIEGVAAISKDLRIQPAIALTSTETSGQVVFDKLLNINNQIVRSDELVASYVAGKEIPVHELLMAIGKAKSELSVAVEIRNRMSAAYREITSMQI